MVHMESAYAAHDMSRPYMAAGAAAATHSANVLSTFHA